MIIAERLAALSAKPILKGAHKSINEGACVMELVSYVAGEPWSDHPQCVCPVISAFMIAWNDGLPDDERDALLRPLIPRLIGTRGTPELERKRAMMAADWLIRVHTPAGLRLAKLAEQADLLAALPEITDMQQCPSLMPTLTAVRNDAAAAWDAARDASRDAAWAAAWDAAGEAAWAAAGEAARDASRDAAWAAAVDAARDASRDAAWAAAWAAAGDAAWAAARDALNTTRLQPQQSALALVERMISATVEVASWPTS